jgi:hypothetical protein
MAMNPNDPLRSPDDPYRTNRADDEYRRAARLDNELQPDPELEEGPAKSGRIALFAVAIALVLGAVFYGLNNSSINNAGTSSTAQNTQSPAPASSPANPAPSGNNGQGVTTGAAPAKPQTPPAGNAPSK